MTTQLFLSWSGELSHKIATLLHEWIPAVIQSAEPFLSSTDIEKGSRWSDHVAKKLEECGFGLIILSKDNLVSPWILFEAGALSKMVGKAHVSSLLIGVDVVDVKQPLSQFQNTVFSREDVLRLLHSINKAGDSPLKDDVLARSFNALWPDFEKSVIEAISEFKQIADPIVSENNISDIDTIKYSLGELIRTVQSLQEVINKNNNLSSVDEDILRDIRFSARTAINFPSGLARDLEYSIAMLENGTDLTKGGCHLDQEALDEISISLKRVLKYVRRNTRPRPDYAAGRTARESGESGNS